MARRGILAELQHQAKVAAREQARAEREEERARKAAIRETERARKAEERAAKQKSRADAAEKKRLEKEAREAHIASMEAQVEQKNLELAQAYEEIDTLLAATLDVDDYVDLDTLRAKVEHPPFDRTELEESTPLPDSIEDPPEPVYTPPNPPTGIFSVFSKKSHAKAVEQSKADHDADIDRWREKTAKNNAAREEAARKHLEAETNRKAELEKEKVRYANECAARESEAEQRNKEIDELIVNLGYGAVEAVQEYVAIVLSNSVYPDRFPIKHDFSFDTSTAELKLRVLVPGPAEVPAVKAYKYTKSFDEITESTLSQKACKDRYSGAVHQVALRSLHEIFEADRRGIIKTISLEVGTETINPATGRQEYILFVAVGAERDSFLEIDLSNVVPSATLMHLGAAISKNPLGLVATDGSGVRRS